MNENKDKFSLISGNNLAFLAFIITIGIVIFYPIFRNKAFSEVSITAEQALNKPAPEWSSHVLGLRASGGDIIQLVDDHSNTKLSLVLSLNKNGVTTDEFGSTLDDVLKFVRKESYSPMQNEFHLKFLSNQFDTKRIIERETKEFEFSGKKVIIDTFESKHKEHFALGTFSHNEKTISFLAMTIGKPIDISRVIFLLNTII